MDWKASTLGAALTMSRRTLVTGGSGFIGTNLVQLLTEQSSTVVNLDVSEPLDPLHRQFWVGGDVMDEGTLASVLAEFRPQSVVHLAARADLDAKMDIDEYAVNFVGTENLLRGIQSAGGVEHVVLASTMLVCSLGDAPTSDTDFSPQTMYGESKVRGEVVTRELDIDATWTLVRPTTVWGPWQIRLRDQFLSRLANRTYFHPSGDSARRAYGYVGNVVHQILGLMSAPRPDVHRRTFYVGDPTIELVEYVDGFSIALSGRPARRAPRPLFALGAHLGDVLHRFGASSYPLTTYRLANMTTDNVLDVSPVEDIVGACPYTLREGIERTVSWAGFPH